MGCGNSTAASAGAGQETMEECMLVYHLKLSIWCPIRQRLCRKIRRRKYHDSIIKGFTQFQFSHVRVRQDDCGSFVCGSEIS
uniref:Uncharacterized protein n=1 Tax=Bos indicus x Bos taurus TaxID=30522 RepID=A0A4W2E0U8_BOBOX